MGKLYAKAVLLTALLLPALDAHAEVKTEEVAYTVGGTQFTGYLAYDADRPGKRPGVVVVHEWWGHNAYARKRAEMLADLGYTAFALDMYGDGKLADHPNDAKAFMTESTKTADQVKARFLAAHELLKSHPTVASDKTAAIGYCFGGMVVLNMARMGVDLDGVISYHGSLGALKKAQPGSVKAKVLAFNGAADPFVKPEQVAAFKAEMEAAGADYRFVDFPGAKHSFTNPEADAFGEKFGMPLAYDADADAASWTETQEFFERIFR